MVCAGYGIDAEILESALTMASEGLEKKKGGSLSGFLPPTIFMQFQSYGILPIASDMRDVSHMTYTPAPDIVHEAAGHSPIIVDQSYSDYLNQYGKKTNFKF